MTCINGIIEDLMFCSEETGFAVIRFREDSGEVLKCVGTLSMLRSGEMVSLTGEWQSNERWGDQFRVQSFEYRSDAGEQEILFMLSSGLIDGVGVKRAEAIVAMFGAETLQILDTAPHKLCFVPGIGQKRAEKIMKSWKARQGVRSLVLFLRPFGIPLPFINRIYRQYEDEALSIISENPYQLIEDMRGVGFHKADKIAQSIGYVGESYRRLRAALLHTLHEAESEGHVFLPKDELVSQACELTDVPLEQMLFSLDHLKTEKSIINDKNFIYLKNMYELEKECAQRLKKRITDKKKRPASDSQRKKLEQWAHDECERREITANPLQIEALITATEQHIMLLTGGPGTGKTTTLRLIVDHFTQKKKQVILAAPTGRAAQKMSEMTQKEAKTIHRLLEYQRSATERGFQKNEANQLDGDVCIVDEFSMVDLRLMVSLLRALPAKCHLILVGDSDQLPSVGAGAILEHLISSKIIPHIALHTIFRQAEHSRIVTAAHEIRQGIVPVFQNSKAQNCFFIQRNTPEEIYDTIVDLACRRLPESYSLVPERDIQVITPMHKGMLGTESLNAVLQDRLNGKSTKQIRRGNRVFSRGDKVMQTSNNYDKLVFNGDIGYIVEIDDDTLTVEFSSSPVEYTHVEADALVHAYCITIHKSQGSEFPALIIPLSTQHYIMLRRKLIYTALTRAQRICVFVGSPQALRLAVDNPVETIRNSQLSTFLSSDIL